MDLHDASISQPDKKVHPVRMRAGNNDTFL
jgi:hypothetical protein